MNWVLGIDTSSIDLGVGLFKDDTAVAAYSRYIKNSHAEHITQVIEMLLSANNVNPSDINRIAVTNGPGSFTGLRIGIAFAKGFCLYSPDVLLYPVSTLEVMAYAAIHSKKRIISAIDARNNEVFWAAFHPVNGCINRLSEDSICSENEFKDVVQPDDIIISDSMGYLKSTVFDFLKCHNGFFPVEKFPVQRGFFCAFCGVQALKKPDLWKNHTDLLPHYLRLSSAQTRLKE